MPTIKYFDRFPPFPSDLHVVPSPGLWLDSVQNGSEPESPTFISSLSGVGFLFFLFIIFLFLLDL
ncbi:hypothetical protein BDV26DRAFT_253483 [Aspergillus bertholletiae]|uniref:Uncharacterized protein n=1 Tax=Aspergillus bertholletiae TaxID=1226010 RepID=A0A5N7BL12_9EURO|nr:hypothetical protein BDV26DRAFT_253483 [Aspergillus bertholletiae]